jgi:predicted site-specific integrase-resolvase
VEARLRAEEEARFKAETEARAKAEEIERLAAALKAREETEAEAKARAETASKVSEESENAVIYARVPLEDQRADLGRQMAKAVRYANLHEIKVGTTVTEVGSRHLPKLMKLLQNSQIRVIVVERRNCLTGFEYIEAALSAEGRRLIAMNS